MMVGDLGIWWCPLHSGVGNEDDDSCDNRSDDLFDEDTLDEDGEPRACVPHELFYDDGAR